MEGDRKNIKQKRNSVKNKKHSTFYTMKGGRLQLTASCAYVPVRRSRFLCCCCWSCRLPQVLAVTVVSFSLFILLFCCCCCCCNNYCSPVVIVAIVFALMTRRKTKRREFRVIFVFIFPLLTLKNSLQPCRLRILLRLRICRNTQTRIRLL